MFRGQNGGSEKMGGGFLDFQRWKAFTEKLKIGPREQTRTTSLPSNSESIRADALIRLVNILIELKTRTKLSVLDLLLYLSLWLWHVVCITALSLLLVRLLWLLWDIFLYLCICTAQQQEQYSCHIYRFNWIVLLHTLTNASSSLCLQFWTPVMLFLQQDVLPQTMMMQWNIMHITTDYYKLLMFTEHIWHT